MVVSVPQYDRVCGSGDYGIVGFSCASQICSLSQGNFHRRDEPERLRRPIAQECECSWDALYCPKTEYVFAVKYLSGFAINLLTSLKQTDADSVSEG